MSLTIAQPPRNEFSGRGTHDFTHYLPLPKHRVSPRPRVDSPVSSLRVSVSADTNMSTQHRGLPLPSSMTLPDPTRPGPSSLGQSLGHLPAQPSQWQGQEDSMRHWLVAKAEEDKRKQEEEKTKQEVLRLDQRRIEQSMLRESLQAGVPPAMVPMIYAGIGGANLANVSVDWLQQYASQLQQSQQQIQHQTSPEMQRESRLIGQTPGFRSAAPQSAQARHAEQNQAQVPPLQTTFSAYQPTPQQRAPQTSIPRSATHTQLPRLTTNEMHVYQPPSATPGSAHPLQQIQTIHPDQPTSSPSIYFHHGVPPNESKQHPQTPASRVESGSLSAHPGSHLSEHDFKESPRKRKAQGGHQQQPPPSAGPQYTSPSFSTQSSLSTRKRAHSNASARGESGSRPVSRRETDPPRSQRPEIHHRDSSGPHDAPVQRDSPQQNRDERLERSRPDLHPEYRSVERDHR